ncbi:unnamed protein product [Trichobilharzia regenti]|nr:unnamed protein product [Trichobilharzia regenti]
MIDGQCTEDVCELVHRTILTISFSYVNHGSDSDDDDGGGGGVDDGIIAICHCLNPHPAGTSFSNILNFTYPTDYYSPFET